MDGGKQRYCLLSQDRGAAWNLQTGKREKGREGKGSCSEGRKEGREDNNKPPRESSW